MTEATAEHRVTGGAVNSDAAPHAAATCELCGRTGQAEPLYPRQSIVRCPSCGLIYYDGSVNPQAIYQSRYFKGEEYRDYVADKPTLQRNFLRRIERLRRLRPGGRLLELGCAYGFFLELAGRHWDAAGVDLAEDGVRHAREKLAVNAVCADFLAMDDQPNAYDVICLWDTIEHLTHPVRVLRKAARWLKPGGVCAVTTGDVGSVVARARREKWRQIHPPSHVFYFSRDTLSRAMEAAGLEVVESPHVGYSRNYQSMVHGVFGNAGVLRGLLTLGGSLDFPVYLNLFDIVMVVARKPGG